MASTQSSTQADPSFDGGGAPTPAEDHFTDLEHALARLVHASFPLDAQACGPPSEDAQACEPPSERAAEAHISQSPAAARLGAADIRPPIPRERLGKRGALACVAIAVCLAACATWAWRSYGGNPRDIIATGVRPLGRIAARQAVDQTSAPQAATKVANEPGVTSAERRQIETMAEVAALLQTVEQLAAGQDQLTRELAKLHAERRQAHKLSADKPNKRMLRRVSAPPAPPVAAQTRKPTPTIALMPNPPDPRPTVPVPNP